MTANCAWAFAQTPMPKSIISHVIWECRRLLPCFLMLLHLNIQWQSVYPALFLAWVCTNTIYIGTLKAATTTTIAKKTFKVIEMSIVSVMGQWALVYYFILWHRRCVYLVSVNPYLQSIILFPLLNDLNDRNAVLNDHIRNVIYE